MGDGGHGAAAEPWCRHDLLDCVFVDFAALCGFVLHTPLTDSLTERECWKRTTALDAFRHFRKEVSAVCHASEESGKEKSAAWFPQ
jgi:hypothetical protein